ncbi:penicillin-binding protein 2 [Bacillus spongiae]|uniref:serine-type D-Ala-D-Ala carboxypeptidase n=1 Tax=Bacillus spongiae TaxID=2683610 RepID=A0ABU8H9J7_9BACI
MNRPAQKQKKKAIIIRQMNRLFFAVFLLFSLLVFRLGIVQIVNGEEYLRQIERTEEVVISLNVPRGKMFDRNGKLLVDNSSRLAITFTKSQSTNTDDMLAIAQKLATLIEKNTDNITERDIKDFLLVTEKVSIKDKVPIAEQNAIREDQSIDYPDQAIYQLTLERITEAEVSSLTANELEQLAIFREMNRGYALTPQVIKVGDGDDNTTFVTEEEFALVSENLVSLPGINTMTAWERSYPFGNVFRPIFGKVTTAREGLPNEKLATYLSRGYSRNDRVGKSFIELQYEDVLKGQKEKILNITDKAGNVLETKVIQAGKRGQDLVLSIDIELQEAIDQIVENELRRIKNANVHPLMDRIFFVMMDPFTGEILAMSGKQWVDGEIIDYPMGAYTSAHEIGSAVKGATVLTGYMEDVLNPGEYLVDEALKFKGTEIKNSWFNTSLGKRITMTEGRALEQSSNSFMYKIALRLAGETYRYNRPVGFTPNDFEALRSNLSQFGLGVRTGIDLPGEQLGYKQVDKGALAVEPGKMLDLAIGQFDTYTPLQMLQYVSTIANGGNRIAPKIVKDIREPYDKAEGLGPLAYEHSAKVLNHLDATRTEIEAVQKGFYRVFHGPRGTSRDVFGNTDPHYQTDYVAAGKTGTAEVVYYGPKRSEWGTSTYNYSLVGYAPYDRPEVAFSVMTPWADPKVKKIYHNPNERVAYYALNKYFELKENRQ